jgi:hypothetical protein
MRWPTDLRGAAQGPVGHHEDVSQPDVTYRRLGGSQADVTYRRLGGVDPGYGAGSL